MRFHRNVFTQIHMYPPLSVPQTTHTLAQPHADLTTVGVTLMGATYLDALMILREVMESSSEDIKSSAPPRT